MQAYPQYPTIVESGGPDLELTGWFGLQGPAGLPADIVARIVEVGKAMQLDPEFRKTLTTGALIPSFSSGPAFTEQIRCDLQKVAEIRSRAHIEIG